MWEMIGDIGQAVIVSAAACWMTATLIKGVVSEYSDIISYFVKKGEKNDI